MVKISNVALPLAFFALTPVVWLDAPANPGATYYVAMAASFGASGLVALGLIEELFVNGD